MTAANSDAGDVASSHSLLLPRPGRLLRESEFRPPVTWVTHGQHTQGTPSTSGRALPVYIGLDLGTAYTKATIGLLDQVFPVDWSGVNAHVPAYLLPTEYTATAAGRCWLGQLPAARTGDIVSGLKQDLISSTLEAPAIRRAAVFVALVLQYLRGWAFERHGTKIGTRPVRWFFNIGTPCDGVEANERSAAYKDLQRLAWRMSLLPREQINYALATKLHVAGDDELQDVAEYEAIPEFVAQLAAYSRSAQRRNGLHALVDIGGGTVDIVTFNVHQAAGEDVFPFFVPVVAPFGVFALLNHRLRSLGVDGANSTTALADLGDANLFAAEFRVDPTKVLACDQEFVRGIANEFARVLRVTKAHRYQSAPEWRQGVRTFVTGGGSANATLVQALRSAVPEGVAIDWIELPAPIGLEFADAGLPFHRVSVAAGLARNPLAFGQIRPAAAVADEEVWTQTLPRKEPLNHEDIYSR